MHPVMFEFGSFDLYTYGIILVIAALAAAIDAQRTISLSSVRNVSVVPLLILILIVGRFGARLGYLLIHPMVLETEGIGALFLTSSSGAVGGHYFLGGFLSAIVVVAVYARAKKLRFIALLDLILPSAALAIAIGRMGCYFQGCCFGEPTTSFLGVIFPAGSIASREYPSLALHPTQIYEAAAIIVVWFVSRTIVRKRSRVGCATAAFLIGYGLVRFSVEQLRWHESEAIIYKGGGVLVSHSSLIAALLFLAGVSVVLRNRCRHDLIPSDLKT